MPKTMETPPWRAEIPLLLFFTVAGTAQDTLFQFAVIPEICPGQVGGGSPASCYRNR